MQNPTPWSQDDSTRPIRDAAGRAVSFTENAPRIIAAVNNADSAAYLLEAVSRSIQRATGPQASTVSTIELIALAPACASLAQRLRAEGKVKDGV